MNRIWWDPSFATMNKERLNIGRHFSIDWILRFTRNQKPVIGKGLEGLGHIFLNETPNSYWFRMWKMTEGLHRFTCSNPIPLWQYNCIVCDFIHKTMLIFKGRQNNDNAIRSFSNQTRVSTVNGEKNDMRGIRFNLGISAYKRFSLSKKNLWSQHALEDNLEYPFPIKCLFHRWHSGKQILVSDLESSLKRVNGIRQKLIRILLSECHIRFEISCWSNGESEAQIWL